VCGIAGLFATDTDRSDEGLRAQVEAMSRTLRHRGPDGEGSWTDAAAGVALAQRRLAVVDLTPSGAQPMVSSCGRFVIVYNGELYGIAPLRRELEQRGVSLRGTSDTEVLLELCARDGVARTLPRLVGMFAFGLWDREQRVLWLARDRLGIKPLYVAALAGGVAFASETRALRACPGVVTDLDRDAVAAYLRRGCLPDGRTAHQGMRQIQPGTFERIDRFGATATSWWSLATAVEAGQRSRGASERDDREDVDEMHDLLATAVRERMVADVPLGAFLSGGIDSTTVVALMQAQSERPIRTFTIGSTDPAYDEAAFARSVARHLGTEHTELIVSDDDVTDVVPRLLRDLDQPFADPSYIPTWLVSELARRDVTVALSGDGGDEVFAGYTRHRVAASPYARILRLPVPVRTMAAAAFRAVPPAGWDALARIIPMSRRPGTPGDQLHKAAGALTSRDITDLYAHLTTGWSDPAKVVRHAREPDSWRGPAELRTITDGAVERMLVLDTLGYLPDDILTKVDRASMAASLEARVPLLDHRVVEAAWRLPIDRRIRSGTTKWILRQVVDRHVPAQLLDRPKRGFGLPVGAWLRGGLRPWAEELLAESALVEDDLLEPAPIRRLWAEHLSGRRNHQHRLWDVLALQAWRAGQRGR
jgi:asparagine synthase (glutamine-hydrolysing)